MRSCFEPSCPWPECHLRSTPYSSDLLHKTARDALISGHKKTADTKLLINVAFSVCNECLHGASASHHNSGSCGCNYKMCALCYLQIYCKILNQQIYRYLTTRRKLNLYLQWQLAVLKTKNVSFFCCTIIWLSFKGQNLEHHYHEYILMK